MAKTKKQGKKSSIKVNDLGAKNDAKGGALYIKYDSSLSDKVTPLSSTQKVTGGYDLKTNKKV